MKRDVLDLYPLPDDHTSLVLDNAIHTLAILRQFHNLPHDSLRGPHDPHRGGAIRNDPALRLHLLVSLQLELKTQLLEAVLVAHDHGYTPNELAVLLDYQA